MGMVVMVLAGGAELATYVNATMESGTAVSITESAHTRAQCTKDHDIRISGIMMVMGAIFKVLCCAMAMCDGVQAKD